MPLRDDTELYLEPGSTVVYLSGGHLHLTEKAIQVDRLFQENCSICTVSKLIVYIRQ